MALELPYGIKRTTPGLLDEYAGPYNDTAAAQAGVPDYLKPSQTVLIGNKNYWWVGGIAIGNLVVKTDQAFTASEKSKLGTVQDRANHTGSQLSTTISDFATAVQNIGVVPVVRDITPTTPGPLNTSITYKPRIKNVAYPQTATVAEPSGLVPTKENAVFVYNLEDAEWKLQESDIDLTGVTMDVDFDPVEAIANRVDPIIKTDNASAEYAITDSIGNYSFWINLLGLVNFYKLGDEGIKAVFDAIGLSVSEQANGFWSISDDSGNHALFVDPYGFTNVLKFGQEGIKAVCESVSLVFPEQSDGTWKISDATGNIAFSVDASGLTKVLKFDPDTEDYIKTLIPTPASPNAKRNPTILSGGSTTSLAGINHIIEYGQSLSVGQTEAVITTSAMFSNLICFDGIVRTSPYELSQGGDTYPTNRRLSFSPLVEKLNDGTSAGILRETPCSGIAESLAIEINKFSPVTFTALNKKILLSAPGWGGITINELTRGSDHYTALLADVTAAKALADTAGQTYRVLAVTWMQGESDYVQGTTFNEYRDRLIRLKNYLNADIKAITGQSDDVKLVTYQTCTSHGGGVDYPNIALAQLDVALNEPNVHMATPMYMLDYNDSFHLKAKSSKLIGYYLGFAINKIVNQNIDQKPIHVQSWSVNENALQLNFGGDFVAPLRSGTPNGIDLSKKGFAVRNAGGTDITSSVSFDNNGTSVNILCTQAPLLDSGYKVQYGINVINVSNSVLNLGCLRDSQGIRQKATVGGTVYDMDNWCPIFEYTL